jgi:myotubularin-related protein 1/2
MCETGRVVIVDARGQLAAMGNRIKGGGYENMDHYPNCKLMFADIENIHSVREYTEKYFAIGYST